PHAVVIQAPNGLISCPTFVGGISGRGTMYRTHAAGTVTTLHAFTYSDGAYPYAGVIQATDGLFYGTTQGGASGYGTVYRMDADGTVTTLHAFTYSDGAYPLAGVIKARDVLFYGTTYYVGRCAGTVFLMVII